MLEVAPAQKVAPKPALTSAPVDRPQAPWLRLGSLIPVLFLSAAVAVLAVGVIAFGWSLPKFSSLTGAGAVQADDWCAEHAVPDSICVECGAPGCKPKGKEFGFCKKHEVHECPLCHPEVAQLKTTPVITEADMDRARRGLNFAERCEKNSKCKLQQRRLQFASQSAAEKAGVEVAPATRAPVSEFIVANGEITYDLTKVARLSSRLPGSVWEVGKQVGDRVQKGEVLALVEAPEVGRAKAEFLQALAHRDLKTKVYESVRNVPTVIPGRTIQEAEAALTEARIRLQSAQQALINLGLPIQAEDLRSLSEQQLAEHIQFLGLPGSVMQSLDRRTTSGNLLPITAPITGTIVGREAVAGEVVDNSKVLMVIADNRQMWLTLEVRIEDVQRVSLGQPVVFQADGAKQVVTGKVAWISTAVDEKTRTVKVRAELDNQDGKLRASTFGKGRIILREEKEAVVVAKEAVHWEGCCHVVFIRDKNYLDEGAPKVFHVRKVVPGARTEQDVEIIAGVLPGEIVASKGSGILRSELLKNGLGDG